MRVQVILSVLLLAGCAEAVTPGSPGPDPRAAAVTRAADLRNPNGAREVLYGDVVVHRLDSLKTAIALDGGPTRNLQDGYVDQVFVLQHEPGVSTPDTFLPQAEIEYRGRALFVRSGGGGGLGFAVNAEAAAQLRDELPSPEKSVPFSIGYGLARRTGPWEVRVREVGDGWSQISPVRCGGSTDSSAARVASSSCSSGGPGSTSCSTSCSIGTGNCSVSCDGGYYSCCESVGCTCTCCSTTRRCDP